MMEKLTLQEEEAMLTLWKNNGGFIREILDGIADSRIPYTTLASTIKNLEKKGYVKGVKMGNSYRYEPLISQEAYKKSHLSALVSDYFKNSYKELVSFFAKEEKISSAELKEIIEMIQNNKDR